MVEYLSIIKLLKEMPKISKCTLGISCLHPPDSHKGSRVKTSSLPVTFNFRCRLRVIVL